MNDADIPNVPTNELGGGMGGTNGGENNLDDLEARLRALDGK